MIKNIRALGAFKTSMLQDVENGKPVEIDVLLTVTRDLGPLVGVPAPFIGTVLGLPRLRANGLRLLDSAAERERMFVTRASTRLRPLLALGLGRHGVSLRQLAA